MIIEKPRGEIQQLTDQQIRDNIRNKIEKIARRVQRPIRFREVPDCEDLFSVEGTSEDVELTSDGFKRAVVGRAKVGVVAKLMFEVMDTYGFKPSSPGQVTTSDLTEEWTIHNPNRVSRQVLEDRLLSRSDTTPGLVFEYWRKYDAKTNETLERGWRVWDEGPSYQVNLVSAAKTIFQRKSA